ncbi:hypothetical protein A3K48_06300 [candidate division WOR-1 bacterium RIFOXYA12_FULL_52_29]|uniref:DUF2905 domain-containing protein n=1 Tax=candidate division WOR-1 bacterium RIFOXYC12_FULL_54_18 TaxID=1802584 RepID=A0A1F4T773_UNCSA|nr:MAG: hypothetical protein A3K44_06300 [candidate division WOR-1 bacterium RIFOXYA2_FULL_51_19]OGC18141.1 MAG: hypothetical protein A3K48_06300 [candidate division WOR-1 bacterium RIFOXYA12_FULL_52_29]OGC26996.1 MAG: hypothetical protein A3K32_06295 [candidate division WOR-1 bacterium RIFOXYB2_FULL_45_9]OGC28558.1 MAG: hypothetical protein A3K49_06300 [candidate division WOR-1 bacterium RIFOXYC12_FULL_54_18]OGC30987.1 MAG: hypothetical protein A2346_06320 [candidate division WOR-1 bacterium R
MAIESLGRMLIYIGIIVVLIGGFLVLSAKVPWIGRLPGDIVYRRENTTVLVPITTMILASIVLTIILNIIRR